MRKIVYPFMNPIIHKVQIFFFFSLKLEGLYGLDLYFDLMLDRLGAIVLKPFQSINLGLIFVSKGLYTS